MPGASGGVTSAGIPGAAGMGGGAGGPGRPDASSAAGGGAGAGGAAGMGGGMNNNECLVYVNTLEACSSFAVRLREMLERDASAAFGGGGGGSSGGAGHDAERVMSCLQGLGSTKALFSRAASDCLEEVSLLVAVWFRRMGGGGGGSGGGSGSSAFLVVAWVGGEAQRRTACVRVCTCFLHEHRPR